VNIFRLFNCTLQLALLFCSGMVLVLQPEPVFAGRQAEEAQLKAAYIYNFGKYVTWPTLAAIDPVDICLLGRDSLAEPLQRLEGKKIGDREITVELLGSSAVRTDCQVLFISRSQQELLADILVQLAGDAVLTVSDIQGFARKGGMIELVRKEKKIRFIINLDSVHRAGLVISSRLLNLATILSGEGNP